MHISEPVLRTTRPRPATTAAGLLLLAALVTLAFASIAGAAATAVPLGTTDGFAVLAGAGITNTGPTTIDGDIGTFPTTTITGAGTLTLSGTNHGGDAVTQQAKTDLTTAYNDAAGQGPTIPVTADLGGQTLTPGVYNSASSLGLTGALTLDAGGDPDAVFVFQAGSTLTTASASQINLSNGAQSCNVFWQVGSSATLGTFSSFRGTILALTDITVTTSATVDGRVLAQNGAVTLDTNTITRPTCAAPPTPTPTPTPTPAPRELYCDSAGVAYDLVRGQDTQPPYDALGLVVAYVDPVTGVKTCVFPTAVTPTPTTPTPTTPTPTTPTPTTPTPTPTTPTPTTNKTPAKTTSTSAPKSSTTTRRSKNAVANAAGAAAPSPRPARKRFGLTG